jgi:hypothetical protein
LQLRIAAACLSLIPLFITASSSASRDAWRALRGTVRHESSQQDQRVVGVEKRELAEEIEQLCWLFASTGGTSPQAINAAETFLRIRELAGGAGVVVTRFSGPEAVKPDVQEPQVLMEAQGVLGEITALFDSLINLSETVEVLGWTIERVDQSAGLLRAELHLARRPLKLRDVCG